VSVGLNTEYQVLALLTSAFKGKANIEGLLKVFAIQMQDLENAAFELLTQRMITWQIGYSVPNDDTTGDSTTILDAEGVWLDVLGRIVGEPRGGRLDPEYVQAIRFRIRVSRSQGTPNDLQEIALLGSGGGTVVYTEDPASEPAWLRIEVVGPTTVGLAKALKAGKPAGVALELISLDDDTAAEFSDAGSLVPYLDIEDTTEDSFSDEDGAYDGGLFSNFEVL
jgi:hypothetical protein